MTTSIAVLGGDFREARVAELLAADGHDVAVFGLDPASLNGISNSETVEEAVSGREWIVCPAPGLGVNDQLYAPHSQTPVFLSEELLGLTSAARGGLVLGKQSSSLAEVAGRLSIQIHEFKGNRALAVVVASAVAEAVVAELIDATDRLLRELHVRVLGYGATGSAIADALVALGCGTSVASRNEVHLETARRRGATPVQFRKWSDSLQDVDIVVNTVPNRETIGSDIHAALAGKTVVDISSPPGGLDHSGARDAGVRVIWARGLAGQRAPLTIGEAQAKFIRNAISNNARSRSGASM